MAYIFYYLTEDSGNLKERNEINYLRSIGRVVVVTRGAFKVRYGGDIKNLNLPDQSRAVVSAYFLWTKICYLLAHSADSQTNQGFPARNLYTGHPWVRAVINRFWPLKYNRFISRLLPAYEMLYFAPFRLVRLFVREKRRSGQRFQRIVVHDALILRLTRFTPFILAARRSGLPTLANVKSWDNPFYSQFACGASGYLTWSEAMWSDIQRFHQLRTTAHHNWGPRPFYNFANAVKRSDRRPNKASGTLVLGYAAAFCEPLMAAHEVKVVAGIAEDLQASELDAKILFRPYPIVPMASYEPLRRFANVEIVDIKGPASDRYGDGREMIRFGSDEERIQYLWRCHYFLSIATSFTFEAALFGLPVIQYFVPKDKRSSAHESMFFERLDISDHILNYFLPYLPVAESSATLVTMINARESDPTLREPPRQMMAVMGFPSDPSAWSSGAGRFIADTQLA